MEEKRYKGNFFCSCLYCSIILLWQVEENENLARRRKMSNCKKQSPLCSLFRNFGSCPLSILSSHDNMLSLLLLLLLKFHSTCSQFSSMASKNFYHLTALWKSLMLNFLSPEIGRLTLCCLLHRFSFGEWILNPSKLHCSGRGFPVLQQTKWWGPFWSFAAWAG